MSNFAASSAIVRSALIAAFVIGSVLGAPVAAHAGRPTIFDLQNYLETLPKKQQAREALQVTPAPAPPAVGERTSKQAPSRRD